jgi:hypothetical protein
MFGSDNGIAVSDDSDTNTKSYIFLVDRCASDTQLDDNIVFTGLEYFHINKLKLFEITNQTARSRQSCLPSK